jgi:hypothetical protein
VDTEEKDAADEETAWSTQPILAMSMNDERRGHFRACEPVRQTSKTLKKCSNADLKTLMKLIVWSDEESDEEDKAGDDESAARD